jgi:hypothetical protein
MPSFQCAHVRKADSLEAAQMPASERIPDIAKFMLFSDL